MLRPAPSGWITPWSAPWELKMTLTELYWLSVAAAMEPTAERPDDAADRPRVRAAQAAAMEPTVERSDDPAVTARAGCRESGRNGADRGTVG